MTGFGVSHSHLMESLSSPTNDHHPFVELIGKLETLLHRYIFSLYLAEHKPY